jgi:endo-1,4-beta-xylanase
MSRRAVVLGSAGALIAARSGGAWNDRYEASAAPLKARAAAHGRVYGAAARMNDLRDDSGYARAFAAECALLVPENELKWQALRPSPTRFDFSAADWMAGFARRNGIAFKGHTLVWHEALPRWVARLDSSDQARDVLVAHITRVCSRYAGTVSSWDVVNEAIDTSDKGQDGLRLSAWLKLLGPDYIPLAFKTAHEADPAARLIYNDYGLELGSEWDEARRQRLLRLLAALLDSGTQIHAVGIQSHLDPTRARFDPDAFGRFLDAVATLGLKIVISELDVIDRGLPAEPSVRDQAVAATYRDYLSVVLSHAAVDTVITWGLTDRYSWLSYSDEMKRSDGRRSRGLPLDDTLARKPAYERLAEGLGG